MDLDYELNRFYWKVDAGAEYAVTQPVFDAEQLLRFVVSDLAECPDCHFYKLAILILKHLSKEGNGL